MAEAKIPKAVVTYNYQAPVETVFDAWLSPEMVGKFMFGPDVRPNEEIMHLQIDKRVNGKFSFLVKRGEMKLDHIGSYLKIDRPRSLSFTWGIAGQKESSVVKIEVTAEPKGKGTTLVLTHELAPGWDDFVAKIEGSWQMMLEALDKALTAGHR